MKEGKRGGKATYRYSEAFKLQVVREYEGGVYGSVEEVRRKYAIGGSETVQGWLSKYGKGHLMKKVIRVEAPGEGDRLRAFEGEVRRLKMALGEAHIDLRLGEEFLAIACRQAGEEDVAAFKKKHGGKP